MKICVVIPSYNEAGTIGKLVKELKLKGHDVLVIDDGSRDDTAKTAAREGALVMSHIKNLGKGEAIKKAFDFILKSTNYEAVVMMDGDGQHHPDDIDNFLEHAKEYNDDITIGNRMGYTKNMPLTRFLTNKVTSFLISAMCRRPIPDTQCGFRLLKRKALEKLELTSSKYDIESEMLINASRRGLKLGSVPIKTIYMNGKSQVHPIKDTLRFIGLIIKSYFQKP